MRWDEGRFAAFGGRVCWINSESQGVVLPESDRFFAALAVQGSCCQSGICHTTVADVPETMSWLLVAG